MRKHGWQLPYHPLQVVAVAVFLALGFAFYVFFVPFVGKVFQYVLMSLYTPLITCSVCLYIWCAAADPADPGVFKSKKYLKSVGIRKQKPLKESRLGVKSNSSTGDANTSSMGQKDFDESLVNGDSTDETEINRKHHCSRYMILLGWFPCALISNCSRHSEEPPDQQMSEDGMFYCSLCKVEVFKNSKHCRVCDKCVNHFDHHCRWINNCIGKRNYRQFFSLMLSALLLLIIQWLSGILVMICAFLERKRFTLEIASKLGSSFSLVPFVIVVACCTILAMIATLPLAQLLCFHFLLVKKGISTYDYIVALRDQEQQEEGQQSPQMSLVSSRTGFSSASSLNTFQRGAWCTPPRLIFDDQFDVIPTDTAMSVSSSGKKMVSEEQITKKNPKPVKISPWALARLNAEEVSKVAAEARKKSKILHPVVRKEVPFGLERENSFGSSSRPMGPRPENQKHSSKRIRLPVDLPLETLSKISTRSADSKLNDLLAETSISLAPLQLEARSAFQTSRAMSAASTSIIASSPESSRESTDIQPFHVSSSGAEENSELIAGTAAGSTSQKRSISDGYEASGGEDSDWFPSRTVHRSSNWKN